MKKRILIIAAVLLLSVNSVFAQNSIDTDNSVSVSEKSDVFKVDNSDLQVDVFQYTDGNAETIYSGLLGGYAGGKVEISELFGGSALDDSRLEQYRG